MDKYRASVIMSLKDIGYDKMFTHCEIVEFQRPTKAGEVVDNMLILSEDNPFERKIVNEFEKGHFVRAIPLRYISLCTSPFDLSEYGFEAICIEDGCIKWCDFSKIPQEFIVFERALQNQYFKR